MAAGRLGVVLPDADPTALLAVVSRNAPRVGANQALHLRFEFSIAKMHLDSAAIPPLSRVDPVLRRCAGRRNSVIVKVLEISDAKAALLLYRSRSEHENSTRSVTAGGPNLIVSVDMNLPDLTLMDLKVIGPVGFEVDVSGQALETFAKLPIADQGIPIYWAP